MAQSLSPVVLTLFPREAHDGASVGVGGNSEGAGEFSRVAVSIAGVSVQAFNWMNALVRTSHLAPQHPSPPLPGNVSGGRASPDTRAVLPPSAWSVRGTNPVQGSSGNVLEWLSDTEIC